MDTLLLDLKEQPQVFLEAANITPRKLAHKSLQEIAYIELFYGKDKICLGDFFTVKGSIADGKIAVRGDLGKVNYLGYQMEEGLLQLEGRVGMYVGAGMKGGKIAVRGSVSDYLGAGLQGGIIEVYGSAADHAGACYGPDIQKMNGGIIYIEGSAGNNVGRKMRRGLLLVTGGCGDFLGGEMVAGTIVGCGKVGSCTGGNMKRGTIVLEQEPHLLPTFSYCCKYQPGFLALLRKHLEENKLAVPDFLYHQEYKRYLGDSNQLGKGEILVYA